MTILRKRFRNTHSHAPHTLLGVLRWKLGLSRRDEPAKRAEPLEAGGNLPSGLPAAAAKESLLLTWIGHSTFLIQHQGRNILTDPIFGHCQPFPVGALRRVSPPGLSAGQLPPVHDVLISHSHYDHLDAPTVRALGKEVRYWVPEGLSGWFRKRGMNSCRELGWWESASLSDEIQIHAVPAQHASGRNGFDRDRTHWCGWVLKSAERSIYFAGDTGYAPLFGDIGRRFAAFDVAMIPIGSYSPRWLMGPMHLNPAEAVKVHRDVGARLSVACHWGTFRLTDEPLGEPPLLLAQELRTREMDPRSFRVLRIGETIEI